MRQALVSLCATVMAGVASATASALGSGEGPAGVRTMRVEPAAHLTWSQIAAHDRSVRGGSRPEGAAGGLADAVPEPVWHAPNRLSTGSGLLRAAVTDDGSSWGGRSRSSACVEPLGQPTLATNFAGVLDNVTRIPPDTMGAVGPDHVMTTTNTEYRIQERDGSQISTVTIFSFWTSVAVSPFDPRLQYDALNGRWIACAAAESRSASSKVLLAISDTEDPTGGWTFYAVDADPTDTYWFDYPGMGQNSRWVGIAGNMFGISAGFGGAEMFVFEKDDLLAGGAVTITAFPPGFDESVGFTGSSLQPAFTFDADEQSLWIVDNGWIDGSGTPAGRISRVVDNGAGPVWEVAPGSPVEAGSGLFLVTIPFEFSYPDATQKDDPRLIDNGDYRVQNAVVRNGSLWYTHTAGLPLGGANRSVACWYELDPRDLGGAPIQNGKGDEGPGGFVYYPSISVNCTNDVLIGCSFSDAQRYISAGYYTRIASDAPDQLSGLSTLKAGLSTYYKTGSGTRNRWGDYSYTVVDPRNDRTFWTVQEYADQRTGPADGNSRWGTWWGRLRPGCVADLNDDSLVDLDDFFAFLNCFDATDVCADVDGNPGVDLGDFFAFFNGFDRGC